MRQGLSLYTADRARGTVDTTVLAPEGENSIVDAPAKKQQKGDFIFRCVRPLSPNHGCAEGSGFRTLVSALAGPLAGWLAGRSVGRPADRLAGWFLLMWQPRTGWMT